MKFAQLPTNSNWYNFYGVGVLTGIGFTMSLFVGNLAFVENIQYMDGVKIGVLTGSLLSTLLVLFSTTGPGDDGDDQVGDGKTLKGNKCPLKNK